MRRVRYGRRIVSGKTSASFVFYRRIPVVWPRAQHFLWNSYMLLISAYLNFEGLAWWIRTPRSNLFLLEKWWVQTPSGPRQTCYELINTFFLLHFFKEWAVTLAKFIADSFIIISSYYNKLEFRVTFSSRELNLLEWLTLCKATINGIFG